MRINDASGLLLSTFIEWGGFLVNDGGRREAVSEGWQATERSEGVVERSETIRFLSPQPIAKRNPAVFGWVFFLHVSVGEERSCIRRIAGDRAWRGSGRRPCDSRARTKGK